jgi:hypothetical protein
MLFIDRLAKITDGTFAQGTGPINIIRKRSHEDCRNHSPGRDEVAMKFDPSHRRHMDIGDQAGRFSETRRCEEIRCGWKSLNSKAKRPHEPFHGLTKGPVIFDNRNQ